MSKERRVYQRFFPQLRDSLGIKNPTAVAIDPSERNKSLDSIPGRIGIRIRRVAQNQGLKTVGDLRFIDLTNPPSGLEQNSIEKIRQLVNNMLLLEPTHNEFSGSHEEVIFSDDQIEDSSKPKKADFVVGQESAISQYLLLFHQHLGKKQLDRKRFNLQEAAKLLVALTKEEGLPVPDGYPSGTTLEKMIVITLAQGNFPLSPEAIVTHSLRKRTISLSQEDLLTTLATARRAYSESCIGSEKIYKTAANTIKEEQRKRETFPSLVPLILQKAEIKVSPFKLQKTTNVLLSAIQQQVVQLRRNIRPQEMLILGCPTSQKQEFIASCVLYIINHLQQNLASSENVEALPSLRSLLSQNLPGVKINKRFIPEAVAFIQSHCIEVITVEYPKLNEGRQSRSYRIPPNSQIQLQKILADSIISDRLIKILKSGLTSEEVVRFKPFFPEETAIGVADLYRKIQKLHFTNQIEPNTLDNVLQTIQKAGITIIKEENSIIGETSYKIPIEEIDRAIGVLTKI